MLTAELEEFCKDVEHEGGAAIRCLQNNQGDVKFKAACREEMIVYETRVSADFRC